METNKPVITEKPMFVKGIRLFCPSCGKVVTPLTILCNEGNGSEEYRTVAIKFLCSDCKPDVPLKEPTMIDDHCKMLKQLTLDGGEINVGSSSGSPKE
jgi:hypothetical protein